MKLSKKIVSLLTVTALVTSLTACGAQVKNQAQKVQTKNL